MCGLAVSLQCVLYPLPHTATFHLHDDDSLSLSNQVGGFHLTSEIFTHLPAARKYA